MSSAAVAAQEAPETEHALGEMCARLALEIELLRLIGVRIEQSLCASTAALGLDSERVRDLQQLDLLMQHLAALRDFMGALSSLPETATPLDARAALERITLAEMKNRLGGEASIVDANNGDVEFF